MSRSVGKARVIENSVLGEVGLAGLAFSLELGLEVGQILVRLVFLFVELSLGVLADFIDLSIELASNGIEVFFFEAFEAFDPFAVVFFRVVDGTFLGAVLCNESEHHGALMNVFREAGLG